MRMLNSLEFYPISCLFSSILRPRPLSVKLKSIMDNTSETEKSWDLIITPRKKMVRPPALLALPSLLLAICWDADSQR